MRCSGRSFGPWEPMIFLPVLLPLHLALKMASCHRPPTSSSCLPHTCPLPFLFPSHRNINSTWDPQEKYESLRLHSPWVHLRSRLWHSFQGELCELSEQRMLIVVCQSLLAGLGGAGKKLGGPALKRHLQERGRNPNRCDRDE